MGRRAPRAVTETSPPDTAGVRAPAGFLAAWARLVGPQVLPSIPRRAGRKPRVPLSDLLPAMLFHLTQHTGTLAQHSAQLHGASLADSSWADRRARMPWAIFATLMQRLLRPRATRRQPAAFWRGWRIVALDGAQFSLTNTPQISATVEKARTRRGRAAFAKLTTAVLLEIGLHNPIAAAVARHDESEWVLAPRLLAQLPKRALVLGDRLYGVAAFVAEAQRACTRVGSHFLLRARASTKPRVITRLPDGSRLVALALRARQRPTHILTWLEVREIRVQVGRPGQRAHELRLWTSLVDPSLAPALELAQLYAQRWEHELYFREVKRVLRRTDLLQSHTLETGAQEIATLILVSALLAMERQRAAGAHVPALRVSFPKLLETVQALWLAIDLGDGVLSDQQLDRMLRRGYARLRRYLTPPRRARTCPRAVRQPIHAWPRLLDAHAVEGQFQFKLV